MSAPHPLDPAAVRGYHAHIYYAPDSKERAADLRDEIGRRYPEALLGRWHDEPVGPHPISMYQVAFEVAEFPRLVPWLALNRGKLTVLVHPQADNADDDHTAHAMWLGTKLPLRLDVLRRAPAG
jgi:aromatic ring-cleaving dioxygenase